MRVSVRGGQMKRALSVAVLTTAILLLRVMPAHAGLWSWLEEFSGPGPFTASKPGLYLTFCTPPPIGGKAEQGKTPMDLPTWNWSKKRVLGLVPGMPSKGATKSCFFYDDAAALSVDADDARGFPKIDVRTHDIGASVPFAQGMFEIGAGMGWISVSPNGSTARRPTVTPLRLVSRPLTLIPRIREAISSDSSAYEWDRWDRLATSFKVYIKETAILGPTLGPEDLGALPGTPAADFRTPS